MKLIEKMKKWFESEPQKNEMTLPKNAFFYPIHPMREGGVRITLDVVQNGDTVDIMMHGLGDINVCLASFLTKGVSYAQQKYNEYKQSPNGIDPIEEPKADTTKRESQRQSKREREEMIAWAKAYQAKRES